MTNFSVTEPHPTVPKTGAYLSGGRGGAGNFKQYTSSELTAGPQASGPASRLPLDKHYSRRAVFTGIGGAGNSHRVTSTGNEETIFQFDEEMLARREAQAPIYHVGRGGAANFVNEMKPKTQRQTSHGSAASVSSDGSSSRRSVVGIVQKLQRRVSGQ